MAATSLALIHAKLPTVLVILLVRNKTHTLPHFLALLEALDYPKDRISLYIRSDHNQDSTPEILDIWATKAAKLYHSVDVVIDRESGELFDDEKSPVGTTVLRFSHVMALKDAGLVKGRQIWADFAWFLDCDVFLTNNQTLKQMTDQEDFTIFAPLITSIGKYSNFWGGMGEDHYYIRTDDYEPILQRKEIGCFPVPVVHSSVFVNLNHDGSDALTFLPYNIPDYGSAPYDDMISFAISAKKAGIQPHICNEDSIYGYVLVPLDDDKSLDDDLINLTNLKTEIIAYGEPLPYLPELNSYVQPFPAQHQLGVDNVYLINLERRHDRREKMEACFKVLGIKYQLMPAVDGKRDIDQNYLTDRGIQMMSEFEEPYHGRPIKLGEIGCFLSHYNIWTDVVKNQYDKVIVFEDDIRFEPYFKAKIEHLHHELESLSLDWDLIFLGRKILWNTDEPWVENSSVLVHVNYTYWTLGYMLSMRGAQKLLDEKPLSKIVPVDEYLPIMYDRHPNQQWKSHYKNRNLKAFSVHPQFVFPTHYVGDEGYFSDTEDTTIVEEQNTQEKDEL